ncbi:MAG: hypothetical protein C0599_09960 [Salinivirgaceae bacterium]|nr:MAG: hypothetical protein C0599_09960 [Salinivirgaceae bacterium]
MKKRIFTFLASALVLTLAVVSCSEEEATTVTLNKDLTASLTCYVEAQLIEDTTAVVYENAPAGTKVFIRVNNSEYNAGASGVTVYETEVGPQGMFMYDIPVTENGTNVTIQFDDFVYDQLQYDWDSDINDWVTDGTETKKYSAASLNLMLYAGETQYEKVQYFDTSF